MTAPEDPPKKRAQPWGVYTLGFLVLTFSMVVVSTTQGHYSALTLLGLLVGLVGAAWCTVKGIRKAREYRLPGGDRPLRGPNP